MDYYRPTGVRDKGPFESKRWNDGTERYHFKERRFYNNNNNNYNNDYTVQCVIILAIIQQLMIHHTEQETLDREWKDKG